MNDRLKTEELLNERETTHGPYKDFADISIVLKDAIKNGIKYHTLRHTQRESLDMILHKIARIVSGQPNHKDHWDDLAGYATLISRELNDGIGKTEPEGPQTAETTEPLGQRLTYTEIQAEDSGGFTVRLQPQPFKGDVA